MTTEQSHFDEMRASFLAALDHLSTTSNQIAGRSVSTRFGWASWIYARMGLAANSVALLMEAYVDRKDHSTIDHVSIGNICRSIIEYQVFLAYLLEDNISDDDWQLRKWTLDIHDCNSRIRLFRSLGNESQVERFKAQLLELRNRIKTSKAFLDLPIDSQSAIVVGNRFYIRGMRAALSAADWEERQWDGIYSYLSGSTHSAPISFYRSDLRGADNLSIVPQQFAFCGFALEVATRAIQWSTYRIEKVFSEISDLPHSPPE